MLTYNLQEMFHERFHLSRWNMKWNDYKYNVGVGRVEVKCVEMQEKILNTIKRSRQ